MLNFTKLIFKSKKKHLKFDSWKNRKNFQVAPTGVEEQNSANGQKQKQSNKMVDLLELKFNRIKQLDELAVRTTMAQRLSPIH
jgi:hypothetical protein